MSNLHFHSDQKLAAEIEAYLAGNMSAAEMHHLEKAMLDDPFLADAVEGLALIESSTKRQNALNAIRKQLGIGETKKTVVAFNYQRYAAAAAIIFMFSAVFLFKDYFLINDDAKPILSEVQKDEGEEIDALNETTDITSESDDMEDQLAQEFIEKSSDETERQVESNTLREEAYKQAESIQNQQRSFDNFSSHSEKSIAAAQPAKEKEDIVETEEEAISEIRIAENNVLSEDAGFAMEADETFGDDFDMEDTISIARQELSTAKTKVSRSRKKTVAAYYDNQVVQRQIKGTITDSEKNPLPGVNVLVGSNAKGVVTDANGEFILLASSEENSLFVNYLGVKDEEVVLEEGDNEVNITIDEELETFSEVVVSSYMKKRPLNKNATGSVIYLDREDLGLPTIVTYASPKGGMKAFKAHLETNMRYPSKALEENIKGTVKLGFVVTKSGKVRDIQVLRSLGYGCDEEAIRLLKTGPDWFPKTVEDEPESSGRTVKIRFKLDD